LQLADPVGERFQFVEGRRNLPAVLFEHLGPIPHQRLRRDAVRRRVARCRSREALGPRAVVLVDRSQRGVAECDGQVALDELGDEPGLGNDRDVGSIEAALHALAQVAYEIGAAGVVDLDPGRLLEPA
jgi:hypothetical protein